MNAPDRTGQLWLLGSDGAPVLIVGSPSEREHPSVVLLPAAETSTTFEFQLLLSCAARIL